MLDFPVTRRGYLGICSIAGLVTGSGRAKRVSAETAGVEADSDDTLIVESGQTHLVESATTEHYDVAEIDGMLMVDGTLHLHGSDAGRLSVPSGDSYTIDSGKSESYETVSVKGTLSVNGTLRVTG